MKGQLKKLRRKKRRAAGLAKPREAKTTPTPRAQWDVKINGRWVRYGKRYRKPRRGGYVQVSAGRGFAKVTDVRGTK